MKVHIWSDFVCPFCYAGTENLYKAIKEFKEEHDVDFDIEYMSYVLNPDAKYVEGETYMENLAKSRGLDEATTKQMTQQTQAIARSAGLEYDMENMKTSNTMDAHRVYHYAKAEGKGIDFYTRLYKAIFEEGAVVEHHDVLVALAEDIGLDAEAVREVLDNDETNHNAVIQDVVLAQQVGVSGVPFFVFEGKYAISGAQPKEQFLGLITAVEDGSLAEQYAQEADQETAEE